MSRGRIAGFLVSNLIGLSIMGVGLQFYLDARRIWEGDDSFVKTDYLAINKQVGGSAMIDRSLSEFTEEEIRELSSQPWVDKVGKFTKASYKVYASMGIDQSGDQEKGRRVSTAMFFESVPEDFLDVRDGAFHWEEGSGVVPVIISKDYLALYNFGFASSAGLPMLSEGIVSGLPLRLVMSDENGSRQREMMGRVIGYSNRFNTILVPQSFMDMMNSELGNAQEDRGASRLIIDVNSPGDSAITDYLEARGWEVAGDKRSSQAAYLLKVVSGIIIGIGSVITLLSLFILILSVSLLMEKNRRKLHSLLMLGYEVKAVGRPYDSLITIVSLIAGGLSFMVVALLRIYYLSPLKTMGAQGGSILWSALLIAGMTLLIIILNRISIRRRVVNAFYS